MSNRSRRNHKLYNYLINTFDISKKVIMDHVEERIDDIIGKHVSSLLNSNSVQRTLIHMIAEYIKKGKIDYYVKSHSFEKLINDQIRKIVEDHLKDQCKITFQFQNNSVRFMEDK